MYWMDSRDLETLLWVARLGGMGAAAHHLNLTQPAVTRRIQELERELGAKVLRRQGRNVVLTPLGQSCLERAERVLSEVAMMKAAAGGDATESTIRVGTVESIALTWFQGFIARIEQRYPKVRLEIDADLAGGLAAKLTRRQIDIALLPGPVDLLGSIRIPLGSCTLKWLGHPRFLPQDRALTAAALAELPTIGMPQDASVYHLMVNWFEEAGISPCFIHRCNSFSVMSLLVRRGIGISLLPAELFTEDLAAGTLKILIEDPKTKDMDYSAAYLRATDNSLVPQLAALAREESWFLGTPRGRTDQGGIKFPLRL
jgi:DNA-binding transcriptional LysR family regulator